MTINITDLKKKIIYRSSYRGTKEMDKLLSSFVNMYINDLNPIELSLLSDLLDYDDEILYNLNVGKTKSSLIEENRVTKLFEKFIYKSK